MAKRNEPSQMTCFSRTALCVSVCVQLQDPIMHFLHTNLPTLTHMYAYVYTLKVCFCGFQWQPKFPCSGCSSACGLLTAKNGTLSDRSELSGYSSHADCEWRIAPYGAVQIALRFEEFSTQAHKDVVTVFECTDIYCTQQQLLAALSGRYSTPQVVMSSTGFVKVVFTSDGSINNDGFTASWTSVRMFVFFMATSSCTCRLKQNWFPEKHLLVKCFGTCSIVCHASEAKWESKKHSQLQKICKNDICCC
jgi:hypothetical protein